MGVLAIICVFVTLGFIRGMEGSNIGFVLKGATSATYTEFIKTLRLQLIDGTQSSSYGIPVLHQRVSGDSRRFILVNLINSNAQTVTVAIDVVNAHVVAYRVGGRSYFLRQYDPNVPVNTLFRGTKRQTLEFTDSYTDLERVAGRSRGQIYLGPSTLDNAISKLVQVSGSTDQSIAESLITIIQMVSEAVRFRIIETQVGFTMDGRDDYLPGQAALSLENNWLALSTEMQRTLKGGLFTQSVKLQSDYHHIVLVDSVASPVIHGLAVLLSKKNDDIDDQSSAVLEEYRTTHISGRNGLCVNVRDGKDHNGNQIQLWPCGEQTNQQWTFRKDGTIRSMGKCMTAAYGNSTSSYVVIFDCGTAIPDATKWALSTDGTITNPRSGLVLTAPSDVQGTMLTLTHNSYSAAQGWRVGNDDEPIVCNIVGYNRMCVQANSDHTSIWMENCVLFGREPRQRFAFYSDNTIRVNSDRNLCVSADGYNVADQVRIKKCQGWGSQRWLLRTDGSLLNPISQLVMDVRGPDPSLHEIILYSQNGHSNQQWLPVFF